MLSRAFRLTTSKDIARVASSKRRFQTSFFSVVLVPNTLGHMRVAFVVSSKIGKRAVTRNLLKRRMRALFQDHLDFEKHGCDVVVFGRSGAITYSSPRLKGKRTPKATVVSYEILKESLPSLQKFFEGL